MQVLKPLGYGRLANEIGPRPLLATGSQSAVLKPTIFGVGVQFPRPCTDVLSNPPQTTPLRPAPTPIQSPTPTLTDTDIAEIMRKEKRKKSQQLANKRKYAIDKYMKRHNIPKQERKRARLEMKNKNLL